MFEFLFKYSPVIFSKGSTGFSNSAPLLLSIGAAVIFTLAVLVFYNKTTLTIKPAFKAILVALKLAVFLLLGAILLEPYIAVSTIIPKKSSVVALIDDSKSMSIRDVEGQSRTHFTAKLLGSNDNPALLKKLSDNFKLQLYRFSDTVSHLDGADSLRGNGDFSDLGGSLEFAAGLGDQNVVSAVIIVTDGANNGDSDPLETAAILKNKGLPVYVVGVGNKENQDIELARVSANHSVIENSVIEIAALTKIKKLRDQKIEFELREEGAILKKKSITQKGSTSRNTLTFSPKETGFTHYKLTVNSHAEEATYANNAKSFLIDNRHKTARVLYVEGYPRAEFKFIRRALDGDRNIQLVSLLRTSKDKFYRQGIKDVDELRDGFPKDRKTLFEFDAILLGSIERAFFSKEDLQNISDFVAHRGGGLMLIGGGNAFSEGGYDGSIIADILPVELLDQKQSFYRGNTFRNKFRLLPTPEGYRNPLMQLTAGAESNQIFWDKLPALEGYNMLGRAKPGATILAVHPLSETQNPKTIMALQAFGRGRSMVFASSSSWLWQMGMPHEDMSHERFWRQIMRWLALSTPPAIETKTNKDIYVRDENVNIAAEIRDDEFNLIDNARVTARILKPDGKIVEKQFSWSDEEQTQYLSTFKPRLEGLYQIEVEAFDSEEKFLGKSETAFLVEASQLEFNNAHMQSTFLKRIAEISGGKYYYQNEAERLFDDISVVKSSYSKLEQRDLWDMPIWIFLIIPLLSIEWYMRRNRGLS